MNTAQAQAFWTRHAPDPQWIAHYRDSEAAPHRQWVVQALEAARPWVSCFEVGAHCGPMLSVIRQAFPQAVLGGCDVNEDAVADARAHGFSVLRGPFPGVTAAWPDRCVDVVLSCYTFAYFDPEDLPTALAEAGRLARTAVILAEPVAWSRDEVGVIDHGVFGEWRHAYLDALGRCAEFDGWTAHCQEVEYARLSGSLRVMRP